MDFLFDEFYGRQIVGIKHRHLQTALVLPKCNNVVCASNGFRNECKCVGINAFALKINDVIQAKNNNVSRQLATKGLEISTSRAVPDWLSLNKEELKGVVLRVPSRDEIQPIANEQAVVEFYSR